LNITKEEIIRKVPAMPIKNELYSPLFGNSLDNTISSTHFKAIDPSSCLLKSNTGEIKLMDDKNTKFDSSDNISQPIDEEKGSSTKGAKKSQGVNQKKRTIMNRYTTNNQ